MNDTQLARAMADHQAGRLAEAAAQYRLILRRDPLNADSLHLLGLILAEQHDPAAGLRLIRQAIAITPGCASHYNSLGHALRGLGRLADAETAYRQGIALRPESAEIHSNLATALYDMGRGREALAHYNQAARLAPGAPQVWYNLANALSATAEVKETEACYRRAIELKPDYADAVGNFGLWLTAQGRWFQAEIVVSESVRLAPGHAGGWSALGSIRQELGRSDAEECYRRAIALDPALTTAHYNLGRLRFEQGRTDDALACFDTALGADPGNGLVRLAACTGQLPVLYGTEAEVALRRERYARALDSLVAGGSAGLATAIGVAQPFFLPSQGQDDRELQAAYGGFVCRVMAEAAPPAPLAAAPPPGQRIRVGIVSGFFRDHTLFALFLEGWLTQIDRTRFEVIGFHTGLTADQTTARCAGWCDRFVQGLPAAAWRDAVVMAAPHILLYPEVGIDTVAARLAAMRLARVQFVAWGHPETTGMPTIDAFLSSDMMEPPDAERSYVERLVRMPNLGMWYRPSPVAPRGLHPAPAGDPVVFWSGQALHKYHPRYDAIFPRIALELGACKFVFIAFAGRPAITSAFHDRLRAAFASAGLDADTFIEILPALSQQDFLDAAGRADIILDTPGWSGGKSTLDCLAHDPAIVTLPGAFMRGRHTAAILRRIGATETIAGSVDDYVSIAVRLARDPDWRASVRRTVAANKHRVFCDAGYIRALEDLMVEAVAGRHCGNPPAG